MINYVRITTTDDTEMILEKSEKENNRFKIIKIQRKINKKQIPNRKKWAMRFPLSAFIDRMQGFVVPLFHTVCFIPDSLPLMQHNHLSLSAYKQNIFSYDEFL